METSPASKLHKDSRIVSDFQYCDSYLIAYFGLQAPTHSSTKGITHQPATTRK